MRFAGGIVSDSVVKDRKNCRMFVGNHDSLFLWEYRIALCCDLSGRLEFGFVAPGFSCRWLRRRYSASEKMQASLLFSLGLFVSLAAPKILRLGKMQVNLLLPSLIRTLADAEDTLARQNASKLAFALAYSYLCHPESFGMPMRFGERRGSTLLQQGMSERSRRFANAAHARKTDSVSAGTPSII